MRGGPQLHRGPDGAAGRRPVAHSARIVEAVFNGKRTKYVCIETLVACKQVLISIRLRVAEELCRRSRHRWHVLQNDVELRELCVVAMYEIISVSVLGL